MAHSLSVALCTRNCAPFLEAQLASILGQTRLPDELVVGDEASTDGTIAMLERFAARAPFPVTILRNETPLRVAANFTQVVGKCSGDLVALCDHDDVWAPERLARGAAALADASVALAISDASLIDDAGRALPGTLWSTLGTDVARRLRGSPEEVFTTLLAQRLATGGTMTLRGDVAHWALPIADGWFQDEWLAQLAALRGRVVAIAEPLMQYRQHAGNAVGAQRDGLVPRLRRARDGKHGQRLEAQRHKLELLRRALEGRADLPDWALSALADRAAHIHARMAVQGGPLRRAAALWQELRTGRYAGDSRGHWSALQDLLG